MRTIFSLDPTHNWKKNFCFCREKHWRQKSTRNLTTMSQEAHILYPHVEEREKWRHLLSLFILPWETISKPGRMAHLPHFAHKSHPPRSTPTGWKSQGQAYSPQPIIVEISLLLNRKSWDCTTLCLLSNRNGFLPPKPETGTGVVLIISSISQSLILLSLKIKIEKATFSRAFKQVSQELKSSCRKPLWTM